MLIYLKPGLKASLLAGEILEPKSKSPLPNPENILDKLHRCGKILILALKKRDLAVVLRGVASSVQRIKHAGSNPAITVRLYSSTAEQKA
jgi:hypothetical protein